MKLIRFGAAALNQTPLDWDGNKRNIIAAIDAARADSISVLCLPELCITGYGCEDAFHSPGTHKLALEILEELVPQTHGMIVSIGLPIFYNKALYNGAALCVDGRLIGIAPKRFLAGDGIHYEPRWFKPWSADLRAEIEVGGREIPIGDLFFDCGGLKLGFEICEDAWVAHRPGSLLALKGVDVILNPSASHFAFGKQAIRERFIIEGSRAFGVTYVYANLLGNEAGRVIYDGGAVIANGGELVASGQRFSYRDVELTTATVDVDANRMAQARTGSYRPIIGDEGIEVAFTFPERKPEPPTRNPEVWECGGQLKEEEFCRAVALGLFDYLRKSHSNGFVVSLSGGADSSACAALVALAVHFGLASLGRERFIEKLGHIDGLGKAANPRQLVEKLLLCAYQATENSGDVTRNAARDVAFGLGAKFLELDVDPLFKGYVSVIEEALGRELDWARDDIALQNIQARVRGPSIWMLTNIRGSLLLATSNRSEAAVGYATMDGDTCGGLSPIAGIDKAFLRQWLRWMEHAGPVELGPVPQLAAVNVQQPTAELRPASENQTDESDLMPYPLLDAIEGAAIRDKHTPLEVYLEMRARFSYERKQLAAWVERFFKLWCRNQWKRERYAPSFHLDDKNLDPKTWCRFPILSGGFDRELAELRSYVTSELESETEAGSETSGQ